MKSYTILPADGRTPYTMQVDEVMWLPDADIRMQARLSYDAQALYVSMRAWERDIRAELTEPMSPVWEDSCMELFFAPGEDGRYFNLEVNPKGCYYLGFGRGRDDRVRLFPEDTAAFAIQTDRLPDGWTLSYRVPHAFLQLFYPGFRFEAGREMRANVYKCGDKTAQPHYLAWNALRSDKPDFHRPEDFGLLCFG